MIEPISSPDLVRAEGSLPGESSATGQVTDTQLDAAILAGQRKMLKEFSYQTYGDVRDYSGADPALIEKQDRFLHAECSFAIGELAMQLNNRQLVETGLVKSTKLGDSETVFATLEESKAIHEEWARRAYDWLAPYLGNKVVDADSEEIAFRTKDRKITLMAI